MKTISLNSTIQIFLVVFFEVLSKKNNFSTTSQRSFFLVKKIQILTVTIKLDQST